MQHFHIQGPDSVGLKAHLTDTIYIVDGASKDDMPTIQSALAREFGVNRRIDVEQVFTMVNGKAVGDMRFIIMGPDTSKHLTSSLHRAIATLTPKSFLVCQPGSEMRGARRICSTAEQLLGTTYKLEELPINDPRLGGIGLTEEDREEIYDDGYFYAITRTA